MKKTLFILLLGLALSGCAALEKLADAADPGKPVKDDLAQAPKYSENTNMAVPTDRNYRRWTRDRMEEESDLGSTAGSTWVMDGQGAYLFTQNKSRKEGDITNVALAEPALKQVETKVGVIKTLLKQLEEQEKQEKLRLEQQQRGLASAPAEAAKGTANAAAGAPPPAAAPAKEEKQNLDDIKTVPSKIVERLPDGNYRVKGSQPFMIGQREYKVIVTGLIRPEDFNDQGISSDKLLDPQYDVVSVRRGRQ